jgi:hypothetical protein
MADESTQSTSLTKLPAGTPKWVMVLCCVVSGVLIPALVAFSPQLSELVRGAMEVRKSQAENERTALGTVLQMVDTNTKQVYILTVALESEQREKKMLIERVTELEKDGKELKDCQARLKLCKL